MAVASPKVYQFHFDLHFFIIKLRISKIFSPFLIKNSVSFLQFTNISWFCQRSKRPFWNMVQTFKLRQVKVSSLSAKSFNNSIWHYSFGSFLYQNIQPMCTFFYESSIPHCFKTSLHMKPLFTLLDMQQIKRLPIKLKCVM